MQDRIDLWELYNIAEVDEKIRKYIGRNHYYDLSELPTKKMKEEFTDYILYHSNQVKAFTLYGERQHFKKLCSFLKMYGKSVKSLLDMEREEWIRKLKMWMLQNGLVLSHTVMKKEYGSESVFQSRLLCYFDGILQFLSEQGLSETEKDIWQLEKLGIVYRENLIKTFKTVNFTKIYQSEIKEELKKGIYLDLQEEAISCVQREMTAMRRLSKFLKEKKPDVCSCKELDRTLLEEYLTYLKTEDTSTKHFHSELTRLRKILESIGKVCGYPHLLTLFLTRDIPPTPRAEFKIRSDSEMKRLNAAIVELDEQAARLMIIHQMLGTRISDTLTLETDCLHMKGFDIIIKIRQMKTTTYEKPISEELAALIKKAISYTKERYGDTKYIFVNENNPEQPMRYAAIQSKVIRMIYEKELKDDNGNYFGFGTHLYRHRYGMKLTEMHLDDWTIAKLLGHSSVHNVKFYRKMSNQSLAEETRAARNLMSQKILDSLDKWEEEYEQIR